MRNKKHYAGKIPFDKDGNLMQYVGFQTPVEERENEPFTTTLVLQDWYGGRSAAGFLFKEDGTGREFPMFISDFAELIKSHALNRGAIHGTFIYVKKGANFGIRILKDNP